MPLLEPGDGVFAAKAEEPLPFVLHNAEDPGQSHQSSPKQDSNGRFGAFAEGGVAFAEPALKGEEEAAVVLPCSSLLGFTKNRLSI